MFISVIAVIPIGC